jgi:predicted short-subunit dehydrogenase-like oxidoreductase (DUF2520 family)
MNGPRRGILILGPGRVGLSLAVLFDRAGLELAGIWGRREDSLSQARRFVRCPLFHGHGALPGALERAGMVLVTVSDGAIGEIAGRLAGSGRLAPGTVVCHCAGVLDSGALEAASGAGAVTGTIHPLQSVPSVEAGVASLPGAWFSLEGESGAVAAGRRLVEAIGGRPVTLGEGDRALYHAAAALAGNYIVTLLWSASEMLERAGMPGAAAAALRPMAASVATRREGGGALTGPVARGDAETVRAHLEAVARERIEDLELFLALTARTIDLVEAEGGLDADAIARMRGHVREFRRRGGELAPGGGRSPGNRTTGERSEP